MIHAKRKRPTKRAHFLTNRRPSPPVILITWYWTRHLIGPQGAFGYSSVSREGSSLSVPSTSHVSPWSDITCRCRHRSHSQLSFCYSETPCMLTVWGYVIDLMRGVLLSSLLINIQHKYFTDHHPHTDRLVFVDAFKCVIIEVLKAFFLHRKWLVAALEQKTFVL